MSENYGDCRACHGLGVVGDIRNRMIECPRCGGTGMSGDASDYHQAEIRKDPIEKRRPDQEDQDS